jgi:hypothetical protein
MTKDRKSEAWFRTHADLAETVNARRMKEGLPLSTVATKKKASKAAPVVERKPYRARHVPKDYVPIEESRASLQRELGFAPPEAMQPVKPETKQPYYVRD